MPDDHGYDDDDGDDDDDELPQGSDASQGEIAGLLGSACNRPPWSGSGSGLKKKLTNSSP